MSDPLNLHQQLTALEQNTSDMVPRAQVDELIKSVKNMFGDNFPPPQSGTDGKKMYRDLGDLALFINNAKKELMTINAGQIAGQEIPEASNQLDSIIRMTEQATSIIMDQCERVNMIFETIRERMLAADPPIEPDAIAGVEDALVDAATSITRIYEACNFQDITGQRIQKVLIALQEIERQVLRMVVVFGLSHKTDLDDNTKRELEEDADLLNGPAMPGQGLDQDEIDDILNTLL